nr:uncharacterized protein LOC109156280 [Ipomoea batatas]
MPNPIPAVATVFDPIDRTNPLYLHPNESPALHLVTAQLEGRSNYHSWARAMEMALRSKNKLSFVDGTMVIPSNLDTKYYYWDQCNTTVLSWIMRVVSPTIGRGVLWINTAEVLPEHTPYLDSDEDIPMIPEVQPMVPNQESVHISTELPSVPQPRRNSAYTNRNPTMRSCSICSSEIIVDLDLESGSSVCCRICLENHSRE